jgi:hypothetical protein
MSRHQAPGTRHRHRTTPARRYSRPRSSLLPVSCQLASGIALSAHACTAVSCQLASGIGRSASSPCMHGVQPGQQYAVPKSNSSGPRAAGRGQRAAGSDSGQCLCISLCPFARHRRANWLACLGLFLSSQQAARGRAARDARAPASPTTCAHKKSYVLQVQQLIRSHLENCEAQGVGSW